MKGFYVPGSRSGSYVASKRDEEGSLAYETAATEVGIQKQAALQSLGETYASTIENAYASYLSNQRDIRSAAMGQGYKEAYLEAQEQNLMANIAEANRTTASVRAELESQEAQAQSAIEQQYQTEVAYLDRVAATMNDYLTYVKSLTGKEDATQKYFTEEQEKLTVDDLYEQLYTAQPQGLIDEEGEAGKTYTQWIQSQLKDTAEDTAWSNWLFYQGGWQDFISSTTKKPDIYGERIAQKEAEKVAAEEEQKAAEEKAKWFVGSATKEDTGWFSPSAYTYNNKKYEAKSTVDAGSTTSANIMRDLNLADRWNKGEVKLNDIIKWYNPTMKHTEYYVITHKQNAPGVHLGFQRIDYKE